MMKLKVGKEHVIVRGIKPEEKLWGPYQFPIPYKTSDGIAVSIHVDDDTIKTLDSRIWFKSTDDGKTWNKVSENISQECGLVIPNGDMVFFPMQNGIDLGDKYKMTDWTRLTPGYDFKKQAEEGTLPIQDGMTYWLDGTVIRAYNADRLPKSLSKKEWIIERVPKGEKMPITEHAELDWPYLTRVVFSNSYFNNTLKGLFPHGRAKVAPDGSVWVSTFSGEGHINPETKQYSPYYSAEILRSTDNCHSFERWAHMEYEADGYEYPYQSGGFSDNDFEFMDDGSVIWFMRSAWAMYTGREWAPMYFSRSVDNGKTWSKPKKFANTGIYPRICKLECGAVLVCYARPGIYVSACFDGKGVDWEETVTIMTAEDRSGLANVKAENPTFHDWDGGCNNPTMIALDENSALLFYSDFYYPDETGTKRKTVLCRKITVEK